MIEVEHLTKRYGHIVAVDDISFQVKKGEILGFLGPNGAGKTTTMRVLTGYIPATEGRVFLYDACLTTLSGRALRAARRHMQMVFQDPYSSLDPRMAVLDALSRGLAREGRNAP